MTPTPTEFPHAYPFRFVDAVWERRDAEPFGGRVRARVTANARAAAGEEWQSRLLLAEAIAQAALMLEGGDAEVGRRGFLAGLQEMRFERAPRAGDTLDVDVRLSDRFGAIVRFEGRVSCGGELLAEGRVLVRKGEHGAAPPDRP
jgi:3-hydroxyacyl-[acyl-carrier-protein] dehydratase